MKRVVKGLGMVLAVLLVLPPLAWVLGVRHVAMSWGATKAECSQPLAGDELIPDPERQTTRGISISAAPEAVFPWVAQMGAGRAAFYSHAWLETKLMGCPLVNGERLVAEWQTKPGDIVRMCPEGTGPPMVYVVKQVTPPSAWVIAIEEKGAPVTTWAFDLRREGSGTRLLVRNRTGVAQTWQELIEPGVAVMERGMLEGIKARAERPHSTEVSLLGR